MGCYTNRHLITFLLFLLITSWINPVKLIAQSRSIPKFPVKGLEANHKKVVMERSLIGSRPPRCERRCSSRSCGGGGHCEAVQVPIVPSKNQQQTTIFTTTYSRGDDISNYKPMCWKCKCGDFIFNP